MNPSVDTWLVVGGGGDDMPTRVTVLLTSITPARQNSHHIISREVEGKRCSLLLVNYTDAERDVIVNALREGWITGLSVLSSIWG